MQKSTFSEKFRYYFENTMSKGPAGVIKWLALVSLFMVLVLGLLILVFGIKGSLEPEAEKLGFEKIIISIEKLKCLCTQYFPKANALT